MKRELVFRICLFVAGLINFAPSTLAFFPDMIADSYGIAVLNSNYELLIRHRAILFGIVGGLMIYSAISKRHYQIAVWIGLISMTSFIILRYLVSGEVSPELQKVMNIDIIGLVILVAGYIPYALEGRAISSAR